MESQVFAQQDQSLNVNQSNVSSLYPFLNFNLKILIQSFLKLFKLKLGINNYLLKIDLYFISIDSNSHDFLKSIINLKIIFLPKFQIRMKLKNLLIT
jgi:hypothetical protein